MQPVYTCLECGEVFDLPNGVEEPRQPQECPNPGGCLLVLGFAAPEGERQEPPKPSLVDFLRGSYAGER